MSPLVTPPAALQVGKDCNLLSWGPSGEKKNLIIQRFSVVK